VPVSAVRPRSANTQHECFRVNASVSPKPRSRSEWTVGVAQRLASGVVAMLVATTAATELCVTRTVGAVRRPGGCQGRLSGRCDGYLVLVELQ
jgi:hypothetical protein